jgi:hypothetical protein
MEAKNGGLLIAAMALHATGADRIRPLVSDDSFLKRLPVSLDQESGRQVAREREPQNGKIGRDVQKVDAPPPSVPRPVLPPMKPVAISSALPHKKKFDRLSEFLRF